MSDEHPKHRSNGVKTANVEQHRNVGRTEIEKERIQARVEAYREAIAEGKEIPWQK
jgi:hypothetical protein